jgi:serine phosphatase RsbU (regulator of sigma subunit)
LRASRRREFPAGPLDSGGWVFSEPWRYRPGDSPGWSAPELDDSSWGLTTTGLEADDPPWEGWNGIGWFRHRFTVDPELVGVPILLEIQQAGSSQVFVDGVLVERSRPVLVLRGGTEHVVAVRYQNRAVAAMHHGGFPAGFLVVLSEPGTAVDEARRLRLTTGLQLFLTALPLAFALVHLALFLHMPATRGNLFYAVLLVLWAATIFFDYQASMAADWSSQLANLRIQRVGCALRDSALLGFIYSVLLPALPRRLWFLVAASAVSAVLAGSKPEANHWALMVVGIVLVGEAARTVFMAVRRGHRGAQLLGLGVAALIVFSSYDVLLDLDLIAPIGNIQNLYFVGYLVFLVCMSVFLARDFAHAHEIVLEQEQAGRERAFELQRLAEDNLRKTMELDEARELQLSMLCDTLPEVPQLAVAADMRTATEVGGDYYDFYLDETGVLTVAIGDATGHGLRAGTLVGATKSLFCALAGDLAPAELLVRCSRLIRGLKLGRLHMALQVLKVDGTTIRAATAGIPPALLFRAADGTVQELAAGGLPLGTRFDPKYQETEVTLAPGDTVLMATDGFAELCAPDGTALGYTGAADVFRQVASMAPPEIVSALLDKADSWSDGAAQEDDITFVVLQARRSPQDLQ